MPLKDAKGGIPMRTTLAIREELIEQVRTLSGVRTKKEAVEIALEELIRRKKRYRLLDMEGKVPLSFTLKEFLESRRKDVPHR